MANINRIIKQSLAILALSCLLSPAMAALDLELTQGMEGAIPLAVAPFAWSGAGEQPQPPLANIIAQDLRNSGQFQVPAIENLQQHPTTPAAVNVSYWRKLGMDNLAIGRIQSPGGRLTVTVDLLDMFKQEAGSLFSKAFQGSVSNHRELAHTISNALYQRLTGKPGIFNTKLAYVVVLGNITQNPIYRLEISDYDGKNAKILLEAKSPILSPAWSPDGHALAVVAFENAQAKIFTVDIASGKLRLITALPGINSAPAWSPDGTQLAVVLSKSGYPKIYVVDLRSGHVRQVTQGRFIDTEPSWAPSGRSLLFTSNRGGSPQIYQVDLGTDSIKRLTFKGNYNARGSYSPDGRFIVMLHSDAGNFNIAKMDLATEDILSLTPAGLDESPSLAPNGQMIIYATASGERRILSMVSIDGRVKWRLPEREGSVQEPAWSPFFN